MTVYLWETHSVKSKGSWTGHRLERRLVKPKDWMTENRWGRQSAVK